MSLFPEVTSKNYNGVVEGVSISYRYFVNDQDVWIYQINLKKNLIKKQNMPLIKYVKSYMKKISNVY